MFVQAESLIELKCSSCKKYLSHFPIYQHPERGTFCGRCPKPDGENVIRNQVYEHIAQAQKFPCAFVSSGCNEILIPSKIPQHEKFCYFRKVYCPLAVYASCPWKGLQRDLLNHFETEHPTFLLLDGQFELDFVNSHKENYLYPYGEDLFVINRTNDAKNNIFTVTVDYIGSNAEAEEYSYNIILENGKRTMKHELTNKIKNTTEIGYLAIKEILNDPISVIAHIEIFSKVEKDEESDDDHNNAVDYELLGEIECFVCMEYMVPPIYQCITGHSICRVCRESLSECPNCKQEFKNTQNFALAHVINHLIYPCKYAKCKFAAKGKNIKQHEATCIYGPFKCPLNDYEDCQTEMPFKEITNHIVNSHSENILDIDVVSLPFDTEFENENDKDCFILTHGFKLFQLHYMYNNKTFYWAVQLIGRPEECSKYKFEIDVLDNSGNNCRAYFKASCGALTDKASAFSEGSPFIYINYAQIKHMISHEFSYRVRVFKE